MSERQREIISALGVKLVINPLEEIEGRTRFLVDYLRSQNLGGFVLGISGGQDSLLAGILAQRAVEIRRGEGFEAEFHAMLLPYGEQADRADAELAIQTINPDYVHYHNIKTAVDAAMQEFSLNNGGKIPSDFNKGNLKARERMEVQYLYASEHGNKVVIGTDHAAEAVHGFFTKHGDGGADILPNSGLTKRQGRAMLQALGAPAVFFTKAPTADLLDSNPGQTDESEMGVSYDDTDDYLEGKIVSDSVAKIIEANHDKTQHKRELPVAYTSA